MFASFFDFMRTNFLHVLPILVAGAFAGAIIIERTRALWLRYPVANLEAFLSKIRDLVLQDKLSEAVALCEQLGEKPSAKVIKEALKRAHQPEALIEHGLEIAVGQAGQATQKRTAFLATTANVATLLGLFGTIAGLISSFEAVGHADAQQKAALLAAGISTAMNATMLGLAVAIPCMISFSFLMNKTNRLMAEVDETAVRSLDFLKQRFYGLESGAGSQEKVS